MDWIWIIIALLVGVAAGGITTYLAMRRRYGDREAVAELRAELDQYRARVTEHFVETADLVNTLTRTYKNVYDHLESGAYRLVGEEKLRKQLDTVDEAPVMIEYMGQRRSGLPEDADVKDRAGPATVRDRRWTDGAGAREAGADRTAQGAGAKRTAHEASAKQAARETDAKRTDSESGAERAAQGAGDKPAAREPDVKRVAPKPGAGQTTPQPEGATPPSEDEGAERKKTEL